VASSIFPVDSLSRPNHTAALAAPMTAPAIANDRAFSSIACARCEHSLQRPTGCPIKSSATWDRLYNIALSVMSKIANIETIITILIMLYVVIARLLEF
jgi:hypothetical protein